VRLFYSFISPAYRLAVPYPSSSDSSTATTPLYSAHAWAESIDISVVIVNYNVRDYLFHCLQSLRKALEYPLPSGRQIRGEIIVIDNASQDGSVEYLQPLFPDVFFLAEQSNHGFGKANNKGFAIARGKYILCLNPDTLLGEETLATMYAYMEAHPDVGASGCKLLNADGSFQLACRRGFPSPWASFTKLSGLQSLFPQSPLFGQYNQTFRSENETYSVDALMGAFMFMRREVIESTGGFDTDFFMYGEDLDLCFRITQAGWSIRYVHTTSVIHYKGESTRRSNLREVKVFYEAMEIFARKHFAESRVFLLFLRMGIILRSLIAHVERYQRTAVMVAADILSVCGAMMIAQYIWRSKWFAFPDYAYPTVFIVVPLVLLMCMLMAGEYSMAQKPSVRRAFSGLMLSFFALSSLTYFFKSFAFSRGVVLMTIAISIVLTAFMRLLLDASGKMIGGVRKRIAFVGANSATVDILRALRMQTNNAVVASEQTDDFSAVSPAIEYVGIIAAPADDTTCIPGDVVEHIPIIGGAELMTTLAVSYDVDEVIITDHTLPKTTYLQWIAQASGTTQFRFADKYDDIVAARILDRFSGAVAVQQYNILLLHHRLLKRCFDVVCALLLLSIGFPAIYLRYAFVQDSSHSQRFPTLRSFVVAILGVVRGTYSIVGLYPVESSITATPVIGTVSDTKTTKKQADKHEHFYNHIPGNIGLTGLVHIHSPEQLSVQAIQRLNDYYARSYSLWLDIEIIMKALFRLRR
jgi:GT2 family glycosyltransferase/lipopolysaccharide/colanic/teichoic acid biosynthesis glycosyltransferase